MRAIFLLAESGNLGLTAKSAVGLYLRKDQSLLPMNPRRRLGPARMRLGKRNDFLFSQEGEDIKGLML